MPDQRHQAWDTLQLAGITVTADTRGTDPEPCAAGTGRRLLLVEDSVTNQLVASTLLKIAGYRVDIASNGMEAVNAVKSTPFDLVLMDIAMPEMDGIAATKAIRALPAPAGRTPIIAMTANAMVGDRERFLDAGMNDYVPKPIERPYLLATIARWLPASPAATQPTFRRQRRHRRYGRYRPLQRTNPDRTMFWTSPYWNSSGMTWTKSSCRI